MSCVPKNRTEAIEWLRAVVRPEGVDQSAAPEVVAKALVGMAFLFPDLHPDDLTMPSGVVENPHNLVFVDIFPRSAGYHNFYVLLDQECPESLSDLVGLGFRLYKAGALSDAQMYPTEACAAGIDAEREAERKGS